MRRWMKYAILLSIVFLFVVPLLSYLIETLADLVGETTSAKTIRKRRDRLREVCDDRRIHYLDKVGCRAFWYNNVMVSVKHKMIYCYTPDASFYLNRFERRQTSLSVANYSFAKRERFLKRYTKVLFVRHPFSRLISVYNDRVLSMSPLFVEEYGQMISKFYPNKTRNSCLFDLDFDTFSQFIISDSKHRPRSNPKWDPSYGYCRACDVNYDVIVKLETLKEDLGFLDTFLNRRREREDKRRYKRASLNACKSFKPGKAQHMESCNDVHRLIKAKLAGLRNKGYLVTNGTATFDATNKDSWFDSCMRLISAQFSTPEGREQIEKRKKERTKEAFKSLKESTYNNLKELYQVEFDMYGYNPDDVLK